MSFATQYHNKQYICINRPFYVEGYQIGEFIETQCVRVLSPLELVIVLVDVVQIRLPDITSEKAQF